MTLQTGRGLLPLHLEPYDWGFFVNGHQKGMHHKLEFVKHADTHAPKGEAWRIKYFSDQAFHVALTAPAIRSEYRLIEVPTPYHYDFHGVERTVVLSPGTIVERDERKMVQYAKSRLAAANFGLSKDVAYEAGEKVRAQMLEVWPNIPQEEMENYVNDARRAAGKSRAAPPSSVHPLEVYAQGRYTEADWPLFIGLRPRLSMSRELRNRAKNSSNSGQRASGGLLNVASMPGFVAKKYKLRHGKASKGPDAAYRINYGRLVFWLRHPDVNPAVPGCYVPHAFKDATTTMPRRGLVHAHDGREIVESFEEYTPMTVHELWSNRNSSLHISPKILDLERDYNKYAEFLWSGASHYPNDFALDLHGLGREQPKFVDNGLTGFYLPNGDEE